MQAASGASTGAGNVAGVLRDAGLYEHNVEGFLWCGIWHECVSLSKNRVDDVDKGCPMARKGLAVAEQTCVSPSVRGMIFMPIS